MLYRSQGIDWISEHKDNVTANKKYLLCSLEPMEMPEISPCDVFISARGSIKKSRLRVRVDTPVS